MKRKNIGIFTGVLLSAFAALNLNAAAIKTGTSAPKMKPVLTVEYEYSRSGQIIGRKINGRKQSYKYDKKGQLLGVYDEKGNTVEEYVYDPAGNILKKTIHGRTTTYKYDKANQLVSSECNKKITKYEYDAAGRLVKEGDKVYSYIGLDKIESVTEGGRKLSSFTYHIDGQLAARVSIESSETFHWDGLALIQRNSTSYVNEPAVTGGNPILADDKILFNDLLGTTLGVKDGDKVTQNNLTAFGESLSTSPMQDSFFTGKPHVGEMGYVFLFRAYRADQGKWQTADPLGYPDGWNNFAYVNNFPLQQFDKLGLCQYRDPAGNLRDYDPKNPPKDYQVSEWLPCSVNPAKEYIFEGIDNVNNRIDCGQKLNVTIAVGNCFIEDMDNKIKDTPSTLTVFVNYSCSNSSCNHSGYMIYNIKYSYTYTKDEIIYACGRKTGTGTMEFKEMKSSGIVPKEVVSCSE